MIVLDAQSTRAALPMGDAIEAMEHAFSGESEAPLRSLVGKSLVMPGVLDGVIAVKVVSVVPGNPAGLVTVFDRDGTPLGVVDGPTLTAIRTGAVSGLATRLLSRDSARTLAMLGAGAMAFDQIEAVREVLPIERVLVWSRSRESAERLAGIVGGVVSEDPDKAVASADVVSCATPATSPLFSENSVTPGTHVNAVGAFTPQMVELPQGLLDRAYVVVDDVEAAAAEAGDLIQAGREPNTTLRDLLAGVHPQIGEDATVFKSVGIAAQDVAAAHRALKNAADLGLGTIL
ncbi:MAG: ornithine cyclodeaminase family protein [Acidobacteria bacterium]|nr:ornithine cyclodeaminase family protein [Acidobacteriota bacterium]